MVHLGCTVPDRCQNLNSKGGESEKNIPGFVGRIARKGEVVGGITTKSDVQDQPRKKNLLGLSAPPPQSSSQMLLLQKVKGTM